MTNWLDKILSKAKAAGAKLSDSFKKKTIENADLWSSCPECKKMFLGKELKKNMHVCTQCCLLYTSPSPRDRQKSRMPSSA